MNRALIFFTLLCLLAVVACSAEQTIVEVTVEVPVEVTRLVEDEEIAQDENINPEVQWALNYLGTGSSAGVEIELARVLFAHRDAPIVSDIEWPDSFSDVEIVGEIVLVVSNNSDQAVSILAISGGTVLVNGEQIALGENASYFGDNLDEVIFPGGTLVGGAWFPVRRTELNDISTITYHSYTVLADQNFESESAKRERLGPRISITADVSEHVFEPWPEDLDTATSSNTPPVINTSVPTDTPKPTDTSINWEEALRFSATSYFEGSYDEVDEVTLYYPKSLREVVSSEDTALLLAIRKFDNKDPELLWGAYYYGEDWIFLDNVKVRVSDTTYDLSRFGDLDVSTDVLNGGRVHEFVTFPFIPRDVEIITSLVNNPPGTFTNVGIIRIEGSDGSVDLKLTGDTADYWIAALALFQELGGDF
jgi:hypothetical protein